jgi:hypothetical protein
MPKHRQCRHKEDEVQEAKTRTVDAAPTAQVARTDAETNENVLAKLLQHGMKSLENLSQITGWGEAETQRTLLSLIAAGRVDCRLRDGRRMYAGRKHAHARV